MRVVALELDHGTAGHVCQRVDGGFAPKTNVELADSRRQVIREPDAHTTRTHTQGRRSRIRCVGDSSEQVLPGSSDCECRDNTRSLFVLYFLLKSHAICHFETTRPCGCKSTATVSHISCVSGRRSDKPDKGYFVGDVSTCSSVRRANRECIGLFLWVAPLSILSWLMLSFLHLFLNSFVDVPWPVDPFLPITRSKRTSLSRNGMVVEKLPRNLGMPIPKRFFPSFSMSLSYPMESTL